MNKTVCFSLFIAIFLPVFMTNASANNVDTLQYNCATGKAEACFRLGLMYERGTKVNESLTQARQFYKKACNIGHATACTQLGLLLDDGDSALPAKYYSKACEKNNGKGCYNLGIMYKFGNGVDKNTFYANMLFKKACKNDSAPGCRERCDANDAEACFNMGRIMDGRNTLMSTTELFKKSCDGGFMEGCAVLGDIYRIGEKVKKDKKRSMHFYQKACDGSIAYACHNLAAQIYIMGGKTPDDIKKIRRILDRACKLGNNESCGILKKI